MRGMIAWVAIGALLVMQWRKQRAQGNDKQKENKKGKSGKTNNASLGKRNVKGAGGAVKSNQIRGKLTNGAQNIPVLEKPRLAGGRRTKNVRKGKKAAQTEHTPKLSKKEARKLKKREKEIEKLEKGSTKVLVPGVQGRKEEPEAEEEKDTGPDTFTMGYTYTTTVTDARVQAISAKAKSTLAKAIPKKKT